MGDGGLWACWNILMHGLPKYLTAEQPNQLDWLTNLIGLPILTVATGCRLVYSQIHSHFGNTESLEITQINPIDDINTVWS